MSCMALTSCLLNNYICYIITVPIYLVLKRLDSKFHVIMRPASLRCERCTPGPEAEGLVSGKHCDMCK